MEDSHALSHAHLDRRGRPGRADHRRGPTEFDVIGTLRTWDRIAHCESGGRWHINTGNGYYGGLQISRSTWAGYGGRKLATLPSRATKSEQIVVGERIRRHQGWGAWPSCAKRLGLR